jgi:hypothetical protein
MQALTSSIFTAPRGAVRSGSARHLAGRQLGAASSNGTRCRAFFKFGAKDKGSSSEAQDPGEQVLHSLFAFVRRKALSLGVGVDHKLLPSKDLMCFSLLLPSAMQHTSWGPVVTTTSPAMCRQASR